MKVVLVRKNRSYDKKARINKIIRSKEKVASEAITTMKSEIDRLCIEAGVYPPLVKDIIHGVADRLLEKYNGKESEEDKK